MTREGIFMDTSAISAEMLGRMSSMVRRKGEGGRIELINLIVGLARWWG